MEDRLGNIVFTGFNKRVVALDLNTGAVLWDWVSPKGSGYVSLLLADDQHLIVSVYGYTYCLDPGTGHQMWFNELEGYGMGVASLVSFGGRSSMQPLIAAAAEEAAGAAGASFGGTPG
jgi:outer membrane protein assembly factor BamB